MAERKVFETIAANKRHLVSASPHTSVLDAAVQMTKANCGSILILDGTGALLGILTERDLMTRVVARARDPEQTSLAEVMTHNPHCVTPDTTVADALLLMVEKGFRHLPVVGPNGKIMGVFSIRDALPVELDAAENLAEFHDQLNDALG